MADNFLAAQEKNHEATEEHEDKPGGDGFHFFSFMSLLIFMVKFPLFRELAVLCPLRALNLLAAHEKSRKVAAGDR